MVAISFTSGKGGTGKTTIVLNLGAALASMGVNVMLVDADMLTHSLSVLCNLEEEKGLAELFLEPQFPVSRAVHKVPGLPNLKVIPSSTSFKLLSRMKTLLSENKPFAARRMNEISRSSDYVLIDTPAGVSREVLFAVSIGDTYCLVTETGSAELEGALVINTLANAIGLESLGVIFNRVRADLPENFRRICEDTFGKILGVIPFDIRFIEAFEEKMIFYLKYPGTPSSKQIRKMADEIIRSSREYTTRARYERVSRRRAREEIAPVQLTREQINIHTLFEEFQRLRYFSPGKGIVFDDVSLWIKARKEAYAGFREKFSRDKMVDWQKFHEDFREFLYFENNYSWTTLYRRGLEALSNLKKLWELLTFLQDESIDIRIRVGEGLRGRYHCRGIGRNILTALLHTFYPDKYGVWNSRTEDTLALIRRKPRSTSDPGHNYQLINKELIQLKKELNTDLTTIDSFMWFISKKVQVIK